MKKLLLLLLMTMVSLTSFASHLLGGYIQTLQHGYTDTVDVWVVLFRDPQGVSTPQNITLNQLKLVNNFYQQNTALTLSKTASITWQGVIVDVYSLTTIMSSGDYRFIYSTCCRGILTNSTSSVNSNFTIALDYKKNGPGSVPNSSPLLFNLLPANWVVGDTVQTILFTYDLDGDSVIVVMDDAINQHANNTFVPLAPFNQLNTYGYYDVQGNGTITWAPTTQGVFGTGYKIEEYRNGSLIGVNRVQQVYHTVQGSTPNVINLNQTPTQDLLNGDSLYFACFISNATSTELIIPDVTVTQVSNSTWGLSNLQLGTYVGILRATNDDSNMDYRIVLNVTSTVGVEELDLKVEYELYDFNGNLLYKGQDLEWSKYDGLYILKTNNKFGKVFITK